MKVSLPKALLENIESESFVWEEIAPQAKAFLGSDCLLLLIKQDKGFVALPSPAFHKAAVPQELTEDKMRPLLEKGLISQEDWFNSCGVRPQGPIMVFPLRLREWELGFLLSFLNGQVSIDHKNALLMVKATSYLLALYILQKELSKETENLSLLLKAAKAAGSQLELGPTLEMILDALSSVAGVYNAAVLLLDEEKQVLRVKASRGYLEGDSQIVIPLERGITGRAVRTKEAQFVNDVSSDPDYIQGAERMASEFAVPLMAEGKIIGVLDIESKEKGFFDRERREIISSLAEQISLALSNSILYEQTKELAITDDLTGLYNRRYFYELAEKEIKKAARFQHPLSLALIDIDDFKHYNDLFGHLEGDQALRNLAELFKKNCRSIDAVARFGGDEFLIIMPETSSLGAMKAMERIKEQMLASFPFTFSIGVTACEPQEVRSLEELLREADAALYQAKTQGKNKIVFYEGN